MRKRRPQRLPPALQPRLFLRPAFLSPAGSPVATPVSAVPSAAGGGGNEVRFVVGRWWACLWSVVGISSRFLRMIGPS
eukprot:5197195-Pyramimonas_sp.AAC.1